MRKRRRREIIINIIIINCNLRILGTEQKKSEGGDQRVIFLLMINSDRLKCSRVTVNSFVTAFSPLREKCNPSQATQVKLHLFMLNQYLCN